VSDDSKALLVKAMPWVFVLIWSTGFVVARYGMPHAPPMSFLAIRYALSVLVFVGWVAVSKASWPRSRSQWMHLAVSGALMHAGYLGGVWTAVKLGIGAGTVALLVSLQPVLTALWISATTGNDDPSRARVSSRQWLGLCMGLLGITMVVWHKLFDGEITLLNLTCAALALASITCGTLYQKRNLVGSDVRTGNAIQLLAAFVVTLPLAMLETEPIRWHPNMVGALMWSVFALSLGGSSLLYLLIQRGAATQVTSLLYLVPPCTALMAWWLFDEALTWPMLAGTMLTVVGVAWVVRGTAR
jgi:drug/metabolite transporter (DMT)-like permease